MKQYIMIVAMMATLPAMAQLDNTVEVTNEVKPVVTDVKKVNVKTQAAETRVKHYTMEYAVQDQPLTHYAPEPLGDYESEAVWKGRKHGYVHLGGGSHGNLDGQVGYQFQLAEQDELGIDLSLKGFNGKALENKYYRVKGWKSRDYQNRSALNYTHHFDQGTDFFVKGAFENRLFNYMGNGRIPDKQHDLMGNVLVGFTPYQMEQFSIGATAGVDFFGQRYTTSLAKRLRETTYHADVDMAYQMADEHGLGLGLGFFGATYANDELKGIGRFRFTPHYIYKNDQMRLQLGVFVSTKGNVAPDVAFTYHLDPKNDVYVAVRGYEENNDFRRFSDIHPAFCLSGYNRGTMKMDAEFHQIDTRVGYRFNTKEGFSGDLNAGFDLSKNAPHMDWISNNVNGLLYPWMELSKSKRFYVNADLVYAYKDIVKVDAKNQLNLASSKNVGDWLSGSYITPAFQMLWTADVKIVKGFYFDLNWDYAWYDNPAIDVVPGPAYERPATVNLGAGLRYTLPINLPLTLFAKGDNLLNQKHDRYFGYRDIGANFLAGFALSF